MTALAAWVRWLGQFGALADPPRLSLLAVLPAEGLSVLALMEGLGEGLGWGLPGNALGLLSDAVGLGLLSGKPGLVLLGDGLGLLGDGLGLLGDGLGLGLLGGELVLLGTGLGLGLLPGLGLVAVGPVLNVAQAVGLGLAVVVALVAGLVGVVARLGCGAAQLAEFGWLFPVPGAVPVPAPSLGNSLPP